MKRYRGMRATEPAKGMRAKEGTKGGQKGKIPGGTDGVRMPAYLLRAPTYLKTNVLDCALSGKGKRSKSERPKSNVGRFGNVFTPYPYSGRERLKSEKELQEIN